MITGTEIKNPNDRLGEKETVIEGDVEVDILPVQRSRIGSGRGGGGGAGGGVFEVGADITQQTQPPSLRTQPQRQQSKSEEEEEEESDEVVWFAGKKSTMEMVESYF